MVASPVFAVIVAATVASCCKAAASFGEAICFHMVMHALSLVTSSPFYSVRETVAIQMPIACVSNVLYTAAGWRDIDRWLARRTVAPCIVGMMWGVHLLLTVDAGVSRFAIGVLFLVFSLFQAGKDLFGGGQRRPKPAVQRDVVGKTTELATWHDMGTGNTVRFARLASEETAGAELEPATESTSVGGGSAPTRGHSVAAVFVGFATGVSGGFLGIAGVFFMGFFLRFPRPKHVLRATFIFHMLLLNVIGLPMLLRARVIAVDLLPQFLGYSAGALVGTGAGLILHSRISQVSVQRSLVALMFISSILLVFGDAFRLALATIVATATITTAFAVGRACIPRTRGRG